MKAVIILWIIASAIIVYIDDKGHRWSGLSKVFLGASLLAFIINGSALYNPDLTHSIAIIELNPTWTSSIILSLIEGLCITGPISLAHIIYENIVYKEEG